MPRRIPESQRIRISHTREEVDAATTADAVLVADEGVPTKSSSNQPLNPLRTSGSPLDAPADPKAVGVIAWCRLPFLDRDADPPPPLWRIAPCGPTEGRKELIGSRMPEVHPSIGATAAWTWKSIGRTSAARPTRSARCSLPRRGRTPPCPLAYTRLRLHLGRRNQPGTGFPAPTQQVQKEDTLAQARKQWNLLDSP